MDNTFAALDYVKDRSNLAIPHDTNTGTIRTLPVYEEMINGAAGGILSNVDDICNWMPVQTRAIIHTLTVMDWVGTYQIF